MNSSSISIKRNNELDTVEVNQIKEALFREFKVSSLHSNKLFFLLKESAVILAMGALTEVKPVFFNGEEFTLQGVVNVVANVKGKGYGTYVVTNIHKYLVSYNMSGLGFCSGKNSGFYEKCGFKIAANSTKQFVYRNGEEKITNQDGQIIFYQDSSERFMEKVIANPDKEVYIPTQYLW